MDRSTANCKSLTSLENLPTERRPESLQREHWRRDNIRPQKQMRPAIHLARGDPSPSLNAKRKERAKKNMAD
jgi:hypothetical protein